MKVLLYLFLLGFGAFASATLAQSPGTFTPTGGMTTPRLFHTATLLNDGRVLIAGGDMLEGTFKTLSSAELYDPRMGTFTVTGNMTTPRSEHTATLLPDGRVLIVGGGLAGSHGSLANPTLASAELYDPATGTFTATANMATPRVLHTDTLLLNGKVLIAGGLIQRSAGDLNTVEFLRSAEIYDPSTGSFTATGDMNRPWADTATLLTSGKVLITKGNPDDGPYLSSAELYDPSTGTFASAGYMNANYTAPTATLLPNGQVLVAGGDIGDGDGASYIAELYDPAAGTFAATGNMIRRREEHTATLLSDGAVLMASDPAAEVYIPVTSTFAATGNMITGRDRHTATLLNDGRVLITGGYWTGGTILASAELYCPVNVNCPPDSWQQATTAMITATGTDSLNFWQWAYYWQNAPAFAGAPNGFGVRGSISPDLMAQITAAGGGNVLLNISAEQWVLCYRQVAPTN